MADVRGENGKGVETADVICWIIFVSIGRDCDHTYRSIIHNQFSAMIDLNHKKLDVWKSSIKVTSIIYKLTLDFPKHELYGLTSQLRRASVSIPSNIAEGAARKSPKERRRFFEIARSSLVEIDTQLEIAKCLNYIPTKDLKIIEDKLEHVFAMLSNLIKKT